MIGQTLSHYWITAKLGKGGMGEVYRAEDTTLDREVALKILPLELAGSQERLERFQREAKTLAALDHPNIVTIFTVEEADGVHFLTMQLVRGEPLSEALPKGGMPLDKLFDTAIPISEALAAAHANGVIHRDLKPANVMVGDDGRVRVLDFGLAKLHRSAETGVASELSTEALTEEGRIVGTMPYMSPRAARGPGSRCMLGHLLARHHAPRDGDGGAPVQGRDIGLANHRWCGKSSRSASTALGVSLTMELIDAMEEGRGANES